MKYYVDGRTREIIERKDTLYLAPELYWEYADLGIEGIIKECWYVGEDDFGNEQRIDFAYTTEEEQCRVPLSIQRDLHFKRHGVKPIFLIRFSVPTSWYEKTIKEHLETKEEENEV